MEYDRMSGLDSWLTESEQDFSLGAKATSYLPSATLDPSCNNANFELPDWMESREHLGLSNVKLFDVSFSQNFENDISQDHETVGIMDDYSTAIKPEDMLVPLSELLPQTSTPQGLSANLISLTSSSPKLIICMKKVAVRVPTRKPEDCSQSEVTVSSTALSSCIPNINGSQNVQLSNTVAADSICDADDLINEVVQMIGNEMDGNEFTTMNTSLDSSMDEADMDDLLSQLESSNADLDLSDFNSLGSEPASPVPIPSPVPSAGSLSPEQSVNDSLFLSFLSPDHNDKNSRANSPLHSEGELNENCIQSEVHSYSRSPRKSKASRKAPKSSPYLEDRRERKKEQNKQAALRYRQKKKQEDDELMSQIKAEEERQQQLKVKYSNIKQELIYLKKIMREVFIAKGILSEDSLKRKGHSKL
ncbi:hypothetical protein OTU49_006385 [Cherax quadricarinatus]|uniref:BZIP domain-containing protein n=1 Tax=Cherax quadricarinatus TaxID=27406 RepID=A0AAW0X213_CHEQU